MAVKCLLPLQVTECKWVVGWIVGGVANGSEVLVATAGDRMSVGGGLDCGWCGEWQSSTCCQCRLCTERKQVGWIVCVANGRQVLVAM